MRAITTMITAILLMASTAWAGPEIMMRAAGGSLPADETFDADLHGWVSSGTGASWQWDSVTYNGGGAYAGFGGMSTDATLSKTVVSSKSGNMTVYSHFYTGSGTLQARVNGGSWTALNTTSTWTKSANIPISAGSNLIEIELIATTVGVQIDQIEFR